MTGRQPGNLSRTLKTMSNYGFVEMRRERQFIRPVAMATEFRIVA
jgi:predicted transcriptional regulator